MFKDLSDRALQPDMANLEKLPELSLSKALREELQRMIGLEEAAFVQVNRSTSIVKRENNYVLFSNQWFLLAVTCKLYAEALYPYCVFFDEKIRNNAEVIKLLADEKYDGNMFSELFDSEEDKERMIKFIVGSPEFRPGKALINVRENSRTAIRSCKDIFGSCILKKISVPDASSGYLGDLVFHLAKNKEAFDLLEKEITAYFDNLDLKDTGMSEIEIDVSEESVSVLELGNILLNMYNSAQNKSTAPQLFGLKYGGVICENNYSSSEIVKKSGISESYDREVNKGVNLYKSIANNEFGLRFAESRVNNDCRSRITGGFNALYYGVPGAGKSFEIDRIISGDEYERVVFHPDYTYSDFVGQIMPKLKRNGSGEEKLTYTYVPGPFTKALKHAINNPSEKYYLVIEEINRGNAPAIFGDIFQLLDREDGGTSKYSITNFEVAEEVFGDENMRIQIPSNLFILATMNTSDQNVFTLDTAFQRRWNMKYISNDIDNAIHASEVIQNSSITWGSFANAINQALIEYSSELGNSEDKQLGAYFVKKNELSAELFPEKALKYLWDDAFKMDHDYIFNTGIKTIGDIVVEYQKPGDPLKRILKRELYEKMIDASAKKTDVDSVSELDVVEIDNAEENLNAE